MNCPECGAHSLSVKRKRYIRIFYFGSRQYLCQVCRTSFLQLKNGKSKRLNVDPASLVPFSVRR